MKIPLTVWQFDPVRMTPYYDHAVCEALAESGCRVRHITSRYLYDDNLLTSDQYQIDLVYFRILEWKLLLRYPQLRRVLRGFSYPFGHLRVLADAWRYQPDIFHVQWSRLPLFDLPLLRMVRAAGIPLVHTIHNVTPHELGRQSSDLYRHIYAIADALIVHTDANREELLQLYPHLNPARVHVVPMIDADMRVTAQDVSQQQARDHLNLPRDVPIVLFFGAIRAYKGIDVLVDAVEQAQKTCPELHLLVAGKPDKSEHGVAPALVKMATLPNSRLVEGFIPTEDVQFYYLAADVVVHPYRQISQSAALLTAMSFGRAVIVTDVGGMPETVKDNGWVVPAENASALAATLREAVRNREGLRLMGVRSRQLVQQHHAKPAIAQQLLTIYAGVLR